MVTLSTWDLVQPEGELSETQFPNGDFQDLLVGWLTQAQALVAANAAIAATNHNAAAAAWIYYRAYSHIAQRLVISPVRVSTSVDVSVSKEITKDQRDSWQVLAAKKKADYEAYETAGASTTAVNPAFFGRARARTS